MSLKRTGNLKLESCDVAASPILGVISTTSKHRRRNTTLFSPGVSPTTAGPSVTASYLRQRIASTLEKSSRVSGACIFDVCCESRGFPQHRSLRLSFPSLFLAHRHSASSPDSEKDKHMMGRRIIRSASVGSWEDDSGCHKIGG
jgi:hypothetical protein